MSIPFIQYLRPNGRTKPVSIERSSEIEAMAQEIRAKGYHFECEVLSEGTASFTVVSPDDEIGDVDIELVPNGPDVPDAVDRLVRRAFEKLT